MRSSFLPTICAALLLSVLPAQGDAWADSIVAPDADHPVIVEPNRLLEVHASLRLPLTPPPGVQQTAAVRGWKIVLTAENAWKLDKTPAALRYELPVMRIRPFEGNVYRILTEPPPWLPEGRYDVIVNGPGFSASAPGAVLVPGASKGPEPLFAAVDAASPAHTLVIPHEASGTETSDTDRPRRLRLMLPKSTAGIAVTRNGVYLSPESIALASLPNSGGRVLTFVLPKQKQGGGPMHLNWSALPERPCEGYIQISDAVKNDAMAYRDLTFHTERSQTSILWDFGDGRFGVGASVRRRWMLTDQAKITVWAFDENGSLCEDETVVRLNELAHENGCSCVAAGATSEYRRSSFLKTFFKSFFYLFHAAFGE